MYIVEIKDIPALDKIEDVPLDDPIKVLKTCQQLQMLCEKENGIGISAVQVGMPWKLFLVKGDGSCPFLPKDQYGYFVNCTYAATTEERVVSLEGCLSLRSPDGRVRSFQVERSNYININGYRLTIDKKISFTNFDIEVGVHQQGIVFQHEIDHQRGILISDIGKELFVW
jgi:peptide deformylase